MFKTRGVVGSTGWGEAGVRDEEEIGREGTWVQPAGSSSDNPHEEGEGFGCLKKEKKAGVELWIEFIKR